MISGTLDQIISIDRPLTVEGKFGPNKTEYIPYILKTRARVYTNQGTRVNENNEIYYSYNVTFGIRHYHKIEGNMIIKWKGQKYRILNITPPDRTINEIKIDTELINE